ncbi:hypothetical protein LGM65_02595 [Burkholderia anthina]|uniref:hypothetical protein n=1 Tax=Burkholderia anthina TaxID=179879 RepID=UPI001CF403A5|nr:hypothetical protein [Burkholderia anthina]MCA8089786.1 hypothetical protein [Burkholderia anthina]
MIRWMPPIHRHPAKTKSPRGEGFFAMSRAAMARTRRVSRDNKVWNVSQLSLERTNLAYAQLEQEIIGSLY